MKQDILEALETHFKSQIYKHKINVDVMLNNPTTMHDTDFMSAIEKEIDYIARYQEKFQILKTYFKGQ